MNPIVTAMPGPTTPLGAQHCPGNKPPPFRPRQFLAAPIGHGLPAEQKKRICSD
jgi:hypothetical protein